MPLPGQRARAGAPNGWRDRCLPDTPRPPHATAKEYASKGSCRNSLRDPNDLPGRERIAHHNLALRPVPRPRGAAGEQAVSSALSAPIFNSASQSASCSAQPSGESWRNCLAFGKHAFVDAVHGGVLVSCGLPGDPARERPMLQLNFDLMASARGRPAGLARHAGACGGTC